MAYNNYGNRGGYNNYGNRGGYQQNNYGGNNNYQQQQQPPAPEPPTSPEEFFSKRIDTYLAALEVIKARGLDPSEFAFAMGGWVTSYLLQEERKQK